MIVRPFTFLTGLLFALSGAYLFVVKHQSQALESQLEQSAAQTRQDEEAVRVLRAQWALEADPSRIAALAAQFTGLQPMKPDQLVTMASLADDLPAPGSPAPFSNPQDEMPSLPGAGVVAPSPAGPPIEVNGHIAAAQSAATNFVASRQTAHPAQLADNALPAAFPSLPKPPPARPLLVAQRVAVHEIAEAKSHKNFAGQLHPTQPRSAIYEASVSAAISAPPIPDPARHAPMGAQVVRIRATVPPVPEAPFAPPLGGGSLLGMAQTGSQN